MRGEVNMLNEVSYLEKLLQLKDSFSVKVITGIRGVGKTHLLMTFIEELKKNGVPSEEIIYINFEEDEHISNFQQLYEFVNEKISYLERAYLLFDEIQKVKDWEKTINAFFVGSPVDIYITDSNSGVLSKVFLSLLSNNYEVINMQPLSFNEYLQIHSEVEIENNEKYFEKYLEFGGLPITAKVKDQKEILPLILSGMYHTILNKDIIARYGVRDAALIDSINRCLASNIGNSITPKVINTYLENIGQLTTIYTMENYFAMINESGIFRRLPRYDVKSQAKVNGSEQFYCADLGILNVLSKFSVKSEVLAENIVYIELLRHNYQEIFVGKVITTKIHFVTIKDSKMTCIKIVPKIEDKSDLKKNCRPLRQIKEQCDKILISLERPSMSNYKDVKVISLLDFMTNKF